MHGEGERASGRPSDQAAIMSWFESNSWLVDRGSRGGERRGRMIVRWVSGRGAGIGLACLLERVSGTKAWCAANG